MQFFSRVRKFFTGEEAEPEQEEAGPSATAPPPRARRTQGGFAAQREVAVPRQPILQNAGYGAAGGVQGLDWYRAGLKVDGDGDLADEFLQEPRECSRKRPPDKALYKVQKRSIREAQLREGQLAIAGGDVLVLPESGSAAASPTG